MTKLHILLQVICGVCRLCCLWQIKKWSVAEAISTKLCCLLVSNAWNMPWKSWNKRKGEYELLLLLFLLQCKYCSLCMCNIVRVCTWLLIVGGMCLCSVLIWICMYRQAIVKVVAKPLFYKWTCQCRDFLPKSCNTIIHFFFQYFLSIPTSFLNCDNFLTHWFV